MTEEENFNELFWNFFKQFDNCRNVSLKYVIYNFLNCDTTKANISNNTVYNTLGEINYITWISLSLNSLSGFGLCGIIITALLFQKWRKDTGNCILLNFAISNFFQYVLTCIYNLVDLRQTNIAICYTCGVLYHYFILAQFSWMFVFGILQFKRFVIVFKKTVKNVLLKTFFVGWTFPLLPIAILLSFDYKNYQENCFPIGLAQIFTIVIPIGIILCFNLAVFIKIFYSLWRNKTKNVPRESNEIVHQWRLAILLFFLLGINWVFGLLDFIDSSIATQLIVIICSSLHGFVIFVYFIVFNKKTRTMYLQKFHKCCHRVT